MLIGSSQPAVTWNTVASVDPAYLTTNNVGRSIAATPDGGYIVSGLIFFMNDRDFNGNQRKNDAWVVKYNKDGAIEWKQNYGGSKDDVAYSIVTTADGGYLFVGHTSSNEGDVSGNLHYNGIHSNVWVVKLNSTGMIQWQKCLGGSLTDGANAVAVTRDGDYVLAGFTYSNDGDVSGLHPGLATGDAWVVKLNKTGSIVWQKCLGGSDGDEARSIDITSDGGFVITGSSESKDGDLNGNKGFSDLWVVKLDGTGVVQWQKNLGGSGHDIGISIKTTPDGGYIICGETSSFNGDITSTHSGRNNLADIWVVKLNKAGTIQWQKCLGGKEFDIGYAVINDPSGGYVVAGSVYSNDGDVSGNHSAVRDAWVVKLNESGTMEWQKTLGGTFDEIANAILANSDGSYVFTGNTTSSDGDVFGNSTGAGAQTWTVKLGECMPVKILVEPSDASSATGSNTTFNVHASGSAPFLYQWYKNDVLIPGATSAAYTTPLLSLGDNGSRYHCVVTNCQGIQTTGSRKALLTITAQPACQDNFFVKTYRDANSGAVSSDMIRTIQDDVIVCGEIRNASPDDYNGYIFRTNKQGTKRWEISFGGPGSQHVTKMTQLKDGNFLAMGYDGPVVAGGTMFLLKFDLDGNIIWRKDIALTVAEHIGVRKIAEAPDGSIIMVAYMLENSLSFQDRLLFVKFDREGNFLFSTFFKPENITSVLYTNDLVVKGGYSYVVGTHLLNEENIHKGFLSKIDNNNGALLWTKVYDFDKGPESFLQVFDYGNDRMLILGQNDLNATNISTMMVCDTSGSVQSFTFFRYGLYRQFGDASLDASGNLLYANYHTYTGPTDLAMCLVNPTGGVLWSKHYPQMVKWPRVAKVSRAGDGSIYCFGFEETPKLFLGKFSQYGDVGCPAENLPTGFGTATSVPVNVTWLKGTRLLQPVVKPSPVHSNAIIEDQPLCTAVNSCTTISLRGNSTVCRLSDTLSLMIEKNAACFSLPQLAIDTAYFSLISYTGNTAKLMARKQGQSTITASLFTACDTLSQSMTIRIFNTPTALNVGADQELCEENSILLNARSGYASYEWQDGSTDSTFHVTKPGTYIIKTIDACGGIYRDTVLIQAAAPIPFSVGPDRTKCNSDTLHISAPDGFLNYSWSNNYSLSSTTAQKVVVNPMIDTAYYVKAEKTPGCFAFDTVRVQVHKSPPIQLGTDRSFCFGDSVVLNAGGGFSAYQWNTGSTSQQISVKGAGTYQVTGITPEGCKSYDTLRVLQVHSLPKPKLDKGTSLCFGESKILDPGAFTTYRWQDGSTGRTFATSVIGKYSVTVTDANGCSSSDSTAIGAILPLPSGFLPQDTAICSYGDLQLKPAGSFKSYQWSTGGNTSAITISQPTTYTLTVVDNNGCMGKDTVLVRAKDCLTGFHVPTAFTPNGDGKNDQFRPLLFGNVKQYQFTIYNRWGEVVFQTTELQKGWNGKVAGLQQETSVFVWTCTYQLDGGGAKQEKGTVTLIR